MEAWFQWGRISVLSILLCGAFPVSAAPSAALGYTPKYPDDFTHFDYVDPKAKKGGELVLSGFGSFDKLNPYILKGLQADGLGNQVFETLMVSSWDEPFSIYGLLAEDMELAQDGLSVTFRLNPKARFSNGDPVLATDVKFSFETLTGEHGHPFYNVYWADVTGCEVLSEREVRFPFAKRNRELHMIIAQMPVFSPAWLQGKAFNEVITDPPIASGPYVVEKVDLGKTIHYRRNPDYWGKDLPSRKGMFNFDRITYKYYKDMTIALEALKAGEFDFMDIYNSKAWARDVNGPKYDSGEILKTVLPDRNNKGMQGFVFNLRKPIFQDIRVRRAIILAFDFEWANRQLFYDQYTRCNSYFSNSELASQGLPQGEELVLLEPFRDQLPKELFTQPWQPPTTATPNTLRANLRQAKKLLHDAGWKLKAGVMQNAQGERLSFEMIIRQRAFERILAPFARNLKKLGIELNYRTIDTALYQRRLEQFDYDMVVGSFSQSQSPGNEQMDFWHGSNAGNPGSKNYMGLNNPVVDRLVENLVAAPDRKSLITASQALDRVLLWGDYIVPNWYIEGYRVTYWDQFHRPATAPLYYPQGESWVISAWWRKQP